MESLSTKLYSLILSQRHFLKPLRSVSKFHNGINIINNQKSTKPNQEEMEARQKALMAKNLPKRKSIIGVKKVVLIASGKGGVGKSTVATNLAVGMKNLYPAREVSLLDADVFGPSLPRMMNLSGEPYLTKNNLMVPLKNYGVKCMSMGFLVKESSPIVWRGLMVMSAIEKLVRGVEWAPSDVLFVDMPPGTGDTQLSFAQTVKIDGAIIVTTPQKVAMQDAIKGVEMFRKTDVPILGHILNMSSYICPSCGTETELNRHTQLFSELTNTEMLGQIPFDIEISDASDDGSPIINKPNNPQAVKFRAILEKLAIKLEF